MFSIQETPIFIKQADKIWTEEERSAFFSYLAQNPLKGDVIAHSQGLRKIRWRHQTHGKRGGVRVIYYNMLDDGFIIMLQLYAKNEKENISTKELNQLKGQTNDKS